MFTIEQLYSTNVALMIVKKSPSTGRVQRQRTEEIIDREWVYSEVGFYPFFVFFTWFPFFFAAIALPNLFYYAVGFDWLSRAHRD